MNDMRARIGMSIQCSIHTVPIVMHQMHVSIYNVSSVMSRPQRFWMNSKSWQSLAECFEIKWSCVMYPFHLFMICISPTFNARYIYKSTLYIWAHFKAEPTAEKMLMLMLQSYNESSLKSSLRKLYGRYHYLDCSYKWSYIE
jgi:hypothetical protein